MNMNARWNGLFFLACTLLSACAPAFVGGGMVATTSVVGEHRTVDSNLEDSWIGMKIRSYYVQSPLVRIGNIGVSVYNGKVLLTGSATNQEEMDEAIRLAKNTRGVLGVHSEIKLQYVSPSELATDAFVTQKVKLKLLADDSVHGLDIHVKTTKGVVYLTGEVHTIRERDQAIKIVREVGGVREVVSYIDVRAAKPLFGN